MFNPSPYSRHKRVPYLGVSFAASKTSEELENRVGCLVAKRILTAAMRQLRREPSRHKISIKSRQESLEIASVITWSVE
jgi:hypothetical protein